MGRRNIYFTIAQEHGSNQRGFRPTINKFERFNVVVPLFKLHKIRFPKEMRDHPAIKEAMDELTLASREKFKSKHDDFIDTISQLGMLKAWKPSQVAPRPANDGDKYWDEWEPEHEDGPSVERYVV
jgi:hypothetical protein